MYMSCGSLPCISRFAVGKRGGFRIIARFSPCGSFQFCVNMFNELRTFMLVLSSSRLRELSMHIRYSTHQIRT